MKKKIHIDTPLFEHILSFRLFNSNKSSAQFQYVIKLQRNNCNFFNSSEPTKRIFNDCVEFNIVEVSIMIIIKSKSR